MEVDAIEQALPSSEGVQERDSQALVMAGGEILSQGNDAHDNHDEGEAQTVIA